MQHSMVIYSLDWTAVSDHTGIWALIPHCDKTAQVVTSYHHQITTNFDMTPSTWQLILPATDFFLLSHQAVWCCRPAGAFSNSEANVPHQQYDVCGGWRRQSRWRNPAALASSAQELWPVPWEGAVCKDLRQLPCMGIWTEGCYWWWGNMRVISSCEFSLSPCVMALCWQGVWMFKWGTIVEKTSWKLLP